MSLLTVVQNHCRVHNLAIPTSVTNSQDRTITQIFGLLNELLDSMVDESNFQAFTREGTWTLLPQEDQGSISTIASNGWLWFHNETFYDRTLRRPLYGPLSDVEWQAIKALPNPGPWYKYRIRGNHLLINPAPTTPYSLIAFEYASCWGVQDASGTAKPYFTADNDIFILSERILQRGLSYRWKELKGLPYQSDEAAYYKMLNNAIARDGTKRVINISGEIPTSLSPGIFVPSGNWPVA